MVRMLWRALASHERKQSLLALSQLTMHSSATTLPLLACASRAGKVMFKVPHAPCPGSSCRPRAGCRRRPPSRGRRCTPQGRARGRRCSARTRVCLPRMPDFQDTSTTARMRNPVLLASFSTPSGCSGSSASGLFTKKQGAAAHAGDGNPATPALAASAIRLTAAGSVRLQLPGSKSTVCTSQMD